MANRVNPDAPRFWEQKALTEMSEAEWESICDGCGRCCLTKLEDEETGELYYTNVSCELLDTHSCQCRDYANRQQRVPDCVRITAENLPKIRQWLPLSCAYRRLVEGRPLPQWHPLLSGNPDSVHRARVSVRGRVVPESEAGDPEHHLVTWVR